MDTTAQPPRGNYGLHEYVSAEDPLHTHLAPPSTNGAASLRVSASTQCPTGSRTAFTPAAAILQQEGSCEHHVTTSVMGKKDRSLWTGEVTASSVPLKPSPQRVP